jgi:hypothetical protein
MPENPIPALIIGLGGTGAITVIRAKEQLLNTYDNTLPKTVGLLALDTSKAPLSQMGQGGEIRAEGKGYGDVVFDPRELGHIGGNAKSMIEKAAADNPSQAYLSKWLLAKWYHKHLSEALFQLEDGAGQYRQLGRLALFKDLASAGNSVFANLIRAKLNDIRSASGSARSLPVFIIGSLAGGTGAGLFIDTAYLVKKLAASLNFEVQLRGYFVLPDAFMSTIPPNDVAKAKQRAYAAVRELSRMVLFEDPTLGYPMIYREPNAMDNPELWKSRLNSKLYDLVYLIDGHRNRNALNTEPLPLGIAPSVADSIVAFIDNAAGEYQRSYVVNLSNKMAARRSAEGDMAFVGGAGAYTIMLPIQQIIEGWAFQLGVDTLKELLTPDLEQLDRSTLLPRQLRHDKNPERDITPTAEVTNLLQSGNPIIDPTDPDARRQFYPTALWRNIYNWHNIAQRDENRLINEFQTKIAQQWVDLVVPGASDSDQEARRLKSQVEQFLNKTVSTEILLSHETDPKGDPKEDYRRIHNSTDEFMNRQLGRRTTSGQREGGTLRDKLDEFAKWQMRRFREALQAYTLLQLNGQDPSRPEIGRKGKLPWFRAVLGELDFIFSSVHDKLTRAVMQASKQVAQRQNLEQGWDAANTHMIENKDKGAIMGVGKSQARAAQEAYRDAADAVFNLYRADLCREIVLSVITDMRQFVRVVIEQIDQWVKVLALDYNSLYGRAYRGSQQVESERNRHRSIASRRYINDSDWENARYQFYIEDQKAKEQALGKIQWHTKIDTAPNGKPRLRISLRFDNIELDDQMTGKWSNLNFEALMRTCRTIFGVARQRESILTYLATEEYKDNPNGLADEIFAKSGALLSFDPAQVGATERGAYLLAHQDQGRPNDITFINDTMTHLRSLYGVGDDDTLAKLQHSDDRFRLTFVFMHELLPIENLSVVRDYRSAYLGLSTLERRLTHILPAEVNIVKYEDRLTTVNQAKRTFVHAVSVLMEDPERFEMFQALWAHGLIQLERDYINEVGTSFVWYLVAQSKDVNNPDKIEEWWLTQPDATPPLIEAMMTFIFRSGDYGKSKHIEGYTKPFDLEHVRRYLEAIRKADAEYRTEQKTLAQYNPNDLEPLLHEMADKRGDDSPQFRALARTIAERDTLLEHRAYLNEETNKMRRLIEAVQRGERSLDTEQLKRVQTDYDLYTLSMLVVDEMCQTRYNNALLLSGRKPTVSDEYSGSDPTRNG